jgi:hypothetical protein
MVDIPEPLATISQSSLLNFVVIRDSGKLGIQLTTDGFWTYQEQKTSRGSSQ